MIKWWTIDILGKNKSASQPTKMNENVVITIQDIRSKSCLMSIFAGEIN